jgi:cell division protein FtsW (lipid II flippase)
MIALRILGALLVPTGFVLVFAPTLVSDPGPAPDVFEAVERHVRWGALIALGAFLIARTRMKPWTLTFAHAVLWVCAGYLVARLIGILLESANDGRQWMWVGVEAVLAALSGAYVWRKRRGTRVR